MAKCQCRINISCQIGHLSDFIFTFGFVRRSKDAVHVLVDVDYVASDELGNLVGLGFILEVQFTYVVVRSV